MVSDLMLPGRTHLSIRRGVKYEDVMCVASLLERIHSLGWLKAWDYLDEAAIGSIEAARSGSGRRENPDVVGPYSVGVKGSIGVAGMPFEVGSRALRGDRAAADAEVVSKLRAAGYVPIGITRMHELGLGDSVRSGPRATGQHPWSGELVPAGSSSGSAIAVAARMCDIAIGGDTGGSVRGPAASCGVIGIKPTWGALSSSGTTGLAWSMDHVGFFGRDLGLLRHVCAAAGISGLQEVSEFCTPKIGLIDQRMLSDLTPDMAALYGSLRAKFEAAGLSTKSITIRGFDDATPIWLSRIAEFRSLADRIFNIHPADISNTMWDVYKAAITVTREEYQWSWKAGAELALNIDSVFGDVDCLVLPATPRTSLTWSESQHSGTAGSAVIDWYRYLIPFNVSGHPALTLPWSVNFDGLPLSIQIVTRMNGEAQLFEAASVLAGLSSWADPIPTMVRDVIFE